MSNKIKGLTVEIGGETTALTKALGSVNKESRDLQSELKEVERLLKLDPGNTELLAQKQKILAESVENTKNKLDTLKEAEKQAQEQFKQGKIGEDQYRAIQREVIKTEEELKKMNKQLKEMDWKAVTDGLDKFGNKSVDIGKSLTTKVTLPILGIGAAAFKFASDIEDAFGATEQIFKGAADDVKKWADELESYYGIAESEALEYANTMGAMLQNIGGLTEEEAAKQSAILVELAGDLTAMFGGTTESAIQALTGALKGNNSMLDNYGMGVNEATIKTKALEMGLYSGKGQMDLATKQAATLALIMEQTADAQGQAAREADGASGSMRGLVTELKNVATEIGEILLPIITPLITSLKEVVAGFGTLSPGMQKTIVVIAGIVAAIGPLLLIVGQMALGLSSIITLLAGAGGVAGIFGTAIAALTSPIGIAVAAIAGAIAIGVLLYKNWDEIKEFLSNTWNAIKDTVVSVWGSIVEFFEELPGKIVRNFNELPGKLGYAIGLALGTLIKFGIDSVNWAIEEVPKIIAQIIAFYMELPGKMWEWLVEAYKKIVQWGVDLTKWAKAEVPKIITSIINFFKGMPGELFKIGVDVVKGLWNGIQSMIGWIQGKISDFVGGIVDGVKGVLGIQSPSKVFAGIGENISLGLLEGIANQKAAIETAIGGMLSPNFALAGGGTTNYNSGGNVINITVQDGEDLLRTLHRLGVVI